MCLPQIDFEGIFACCLGVSDVDQPSLTSPNLLTYFLAGARYAFRQDLLRELNSVLEKVSSHENADAGKLLEGTRAARATEEVAISQLDQTVQEVVPQGAG